MRDSALHPASVSHRGFAALLIGLGLMMVTLVGFGQGDMLHELVHDGRHALAFPCH